MTLKEIFSNKTQDIEFNQKITNVAIIALAILVIPLIIYINFFAEGEKYDHPISTLSNNILVVVMIMIMIFFKKVPYLFKRILLGSILFFFGLKAMFFANIEFMSSIFIVLLTYFLLTSSPRTSLTIFIFILLLYIFFPILHHQNIVAFYHNPQSFHFDINNIIIRIGSTLLAIIFMATLMFYVFVNNKNNISLLEANIDKIIQLNEVLQQEINDRKTAEMLAVEQAHNYLTLFNNSFDGFILSNEEYKILEVNKAMINISGYERHELIGNNILDLLDHTHITELFELRSRVLKGEESPDLIIETKTKSGEQLSLQIQSVAIEGEHGYNFLSIIKDISKQHIIMEKLRKREELYRTLFEQTNDSILIMNGSDIIDYNAVANELYSIDESQQTIIPPYTNIDQEFEDPNASVHLQERVSLALCGIPQTFEWKHTFLNKKESTFTLVNLQELKVLGPDYYMVVEKNITDRKKNQNMILNSIIQTEENERKRISSDLHDGIGPLLTTIKLYTQALSDTQDPDRQEMIKDKLGNLIEEAVNSISEISFNISPHILLNYGIIAAVNSYLEKFSLHERMDIEFKHDEIERLDEHIEITIYRLFTELINNTLKHSQATKVMFSITNNGSSIQLSYQDNGIGFDTEKVKQNRKGMGLENFKSRILSFNGIFLLKSKPGSGLYVKIVLPKTI